ncbi:LYAM2 protein, partial [Pelecanoides urinatrix]|nr:LYAM2 protein [Pelecanoides urinatrix]
VTCPALEMPAHGAVNCSHPSVELTWGTTCEFTCEEGFTLPRPATLQCGSSGAWDRQQPSCAAVRCEAVTWPEEGLVTCDHAPADLTYRSRCDFRCSEGYVLDGTSSIECTAQGQWSEPGPGSELNSVLPLMFSSVTCPALEMPAHGSVNCSHPKGQRQESPQSLLTISFCISVVQCEPLSSPEKGSMDCSHGAGNFTYNTACHFSCLEGWRLNGSHVLECSHSGNWSASLPTCEASEQVTYVSVGIAATSASLLSTASFLLWLARHF